MMCIAQSASHATEDTFEVSQTILSSLPVGQCWRAHGRLAGICRARCVQVAKAVWDKVSPGSTAWFDFDESGNKQICVMYTRQAPIGQKGATPPWEPGSQPPPFLAELQAQGRVGSSASSGPAAQQPRR